MSTFDEIRSRIDAAPDLDAALATLLEDLAVRVKATSNDQNVQKLSRELRAAAPALVQSIAKKQVPVAAD